jgi:hypothetical protein
MAARTMRFARRAAVILSMREAFRPEAGGVKGKGPARPGHGKIPKAMLAQSSTLN